MTEQSAGSSIFWASDLHLDHITAAGRALLHAQLAASTASVVLVTGDISHARRLVADLGWLADASDRPLYFVLGNHDHYGTTIGAVRDAVVALAEQRPEIHWLPPAGVVLLGTDTALIGVDGWADGRVGDALTTRFVLNDDRLIGELAVQPGRAAKLAVKRVLADADATRLGVLLERAAKSAKTIIVATHVPPFVEALPERGHLADPDWQPILLCGATGAVLRHFASDHPDRQFLVLCGHTHVAADVIVLPNLRCRVMAAQNGAPGTELLEPGRT